MDARVAIDIPALLGEGPLWHPEQQALWYCDIPARRINRFHPASGASETLPPRATARNTGPALISAAASHACTASTGRSR